MTIAVIGAGPAGLAAAWRLTDAGHDVVVLEASEHVGGMAGSRTIAGIDVDLGSHRLHPVMSAQVRAAVEELVELQVRPRNGRIRLGNRWVPFPLTASGLLQGLPAGVAVRAAFDAGTAPLRRPSADTYAEVLRSGLGPTVWRRFHEPYAWKLWGTDPEELAGELARRRVSATGPVDIARRVLRGRGDTPTFLYPTKGFGALTEAMAERIPTVRFGARVDSLTEDDTAVHIGIAGGEVVRASHVLSTMPAGKTAAMLGLARPSLVNGVQRAMVLVYLVLGRRQYTPFDAHYLPERTVLPTRLSEPLNYRSDPARPQDRTVLCAEVPCWVSDEIWTAPDAVLGPRVADDLVRSGLPEPRYRAVETVRLPSVYPVLTARTLDALARAEAAMDRSARVTVLGRQGLSTPDNTHHVLEMGFAAAGCVRADGTFDRSAWRSAREGFRSFVVED